MPEAAQTANPAAPAAGNATLLSATGPAETPPPTPEPTPPADPPAEGEPPAEPPKEGEGEGEGEGEKQDDGAPEEYGQFTAPDGVTLDQAALDAALPVFRELKLNQLQAQRLVDVVAGMQARQAEAQAAQVQQWADETMADRELGGPHWDGTYQSAKRAYDRFASPELQALLDTTGLGNHREVVRFFAAVGKAIGDDSHVVGGAPPQATDFATSFYANMPKLERVR